VNPSSLRRTIGRLLVAALVVECVVLGVIQVRRRIGHEDVTPVAPGSPAGPAAGTDAPGAPPAAATASPRAAPGNAPPSPAPGRETGAQPGATSVTTPRVSPRAVPPADEHATESARPASAPGPAANVRTPGANPTAPGVRPLAAGSPSNRLPVPASGAPAPAMPGAAIPAPSVVVPGVPAAPGGAAAPAPAGPSKPAAQPADDKPSEPEEPPDDDSGADSTPPVLESLHFDPPQVEGGAVTTLFVRASDAKSGVKSVWGEVRSPNRSAVISFGSANVVSSLDLSFPIALPRAAQSGLWYVAWISLTDRADNSKLIQAPSAASAPPGGTFTAFSPESDATPPDILRVSFDRSAVGPGEKNAILVEARDEQSGVASVVGACQSPSKSALIWFSGVLNEDAGAWIADVAIPKTADCGEWVVQQLAVKDKAGNTTLLGADSPLLARVGFQVSSGSNCDFTPPTLDAFELTPAIVLSGTATEIVVTARVSDEGAGAEALTGWFEGPPPAAGGQVPKNYFNCSPDPKNPDGPWTGRIQVPQLAARGVWKVGSIRLEDKARNVRTYTSADPVVSGRVFQVQ
jgi:hypothetical protein